MGCTITCPKCSITIQRHARKWFDMRDEFLVKTQTPQTPQTTHIDINNIHTTNNTRNTRSTHKHKQHNHHKLVMWTVYAQAYVHHKLELCNGNAIQVQTRNVMC